MVGKSPRRNQSLMAIKPTTTSRLPTSFKLAAELADLGYIAAGSITQRSTRCGTPRCRCRAPTPASHGPYWGWTAKVNGKTVTRRLSQTEAKLYHEWISNQRQLARRRPDRRDPADPPPKASELMITKAKKPKVNRKLRFGDSAGTCR